VTDRNVGETPRDPNAPKARFVKVRAMVDRPFKLVSKRSGTSKAHPEFGRATYLVLGKEPSEGGKEREVLMGVQDTSVMGNQFAEEAPVKGKTYAVRKREAETESGFVLVLVETTDAVVPLPTEAENAKA
jgi:hypothetical protein